MAIPAWSWIVAGVVLIGLLVTTVWLSSQDQSPAEQTPIIFSR